MAAEMGQADAPEEGAWPLGRGRGARPVQAPVFAAHFTTVAKHSWIVYTSCVPAVPSRCQHQTPATHSSMSLSGGEALFGWAAHIPGPQPTLTSYLARAGN